MKTLIVYYSRTGTAKKVAEELAQRLDADVEEIIDKKKRSGLLGYLRGGNEARHKNMTEIESATYDPSSYEMIILGAPVWSGNMPPALRTYIDRYDFSGKKVAFFCTMHAAGDASFFSSIEKEIESVPLATLALRAKEVNNETYKEKIADFIQIF